MPASEPLPTLRDLLAASAAGIATREPRADVGRGARYPHVGGAGAILFTREASRDRDLFRAVYLDTAEGDDLTRLVKLRFGVDRHVSSAGTGSALLTRATTTAGAGTIWAGTRILVFASAASPRASLYAVSTDVAMGATTMAITVPVRAATVGPGSAVNLSGPAVGRIDDPVWDPSLTVAAIQCADGTLLEPASDLRARARATRLAARKGYAQAISDACVAQGAVHVALFDSNFTPVDSGLSHCYVADAGFTTPPRLVRACTAALESYRVCGADLQVLGMQRMSIDVSARVTLRDDPGRLPSSDLALRQALAASFEPTRFDYDLGELAGVLSAASDDVQDVAFDQPSAGAGILVGGQMPAHLTRYELGVVTLRYVGPS
jgi:hypothetical protein